MVARIRRRQSRLFLLKLEPTSTLLPPGPFLQSVQIPNTRINVRRPSQNDAQAFPLELPLRLDNRNLGAWASSHIPIAWCRTPVESVVVLFLDRQIPAAGGATINQGHLKKNKSIASRFWRTSDGESFLKIAQTVPSSGQAKVRTAGLV